MGFRIHSDWDMQVEEEMYQLRPMNCPFHIAVYKHKQYSYRDLPLRFAELGTVYRYERSGTMHGLFRVRGFTQVHPVHIVIWLVRTFCLCHYLCHLPLSFCLCINGHGFVRCCFPNHCWSSAPVSWPHSINLLRSVHEFCTARW